MKQMYGAVEFREDDQWFDVIRLGSLLLKHGDLYGCLFGVDNFARYEPLFADRGLPPDCSEYLNHEAGSLVEADNHPTWVLWSELKRVNWDERAPERDERITELVVHPDGRETQITKWLNEPRWAHARRVLDEHPDAEVRMDDRVFRRLTLTRRECLADTDFPLLMKLMECLAERFGDDAVRIVGWFE